MAPLRYLGMGTVMVMEKEMKVVEMTEKAKEMVPVREMREMVMEVEM